MSNVKKIQQALGELPALVMTDAVSIRRGEHPLCLRLSHRRRRRRHQP